MLFDKICEPLEYLVGVDKNIDDSSFGMGILYLVVYWNSKGTYTG